MKAVVQRVSGASVEVDGQTVGKIGGGLLVFLGVGRDDVGAELITPAACPRSEPGDMTARTGAGDAIANPGHRPSRRRARGGAARAASLADKVAHLRIFSDAEGRSNLSLLDTGGSALVVSQFTLYGDCRRGRRPSFTEAADPAPAEALVEEFRLAMEGLGVHTATGRFGAHMTISLVNDGPYTIVLDTEVLAGPRSGPCARSDGGQGDGAAPASGPAPAESRAG